MTSFSRLTVFFDGECAVCSDEIARFARLDHHGRLNLVDIGKPAFNPISYGRKLEDFKVHLHVQDREGNFYTGVEAFTMIWHALSPPLSLFGKGISSLDSFDHKVLDRFRKIIPFRKGDGGGNFLSRS